MTIAWELIGSGLKVCILEAGGHLEDPATDELYHAVSIGHPVAGLAGRHRIFGGSSLTWGGRCAKYDPIDFERRDWVAHSGWPITYTSLAPYYERAILVSNFDKLWGPMSEVEASLGNALPTLTTGMLDNFVWRFASRDRNPDWRTLISLGFKGRMNWAAAYGADVEKDSNTTVILHANVTGFECTASGQTVTGVQVQTLNRRSLTVKPKAVVLAAGGIENPRLLLSAPSEMVAHYNAFDVCGRYFMQHPRGEVAKIEHSPEQALRLQRTYNNFFFSPRVRQSYEVGLALSDAAQRDHHLLNASGSFYFAGRDDGGWQALRALRQTFTDKGPGKLNAALLKSLFEDLPEIGANAWRKYVSSTRLNFRNPVSIIKIDLEQAPNPESRISLSDERNKLGSRFALVDWRLSEQERETSRYFAYAAKAELEQLDLGTCHVAPWVDSTSPMEEEHLAGNYHFIGATRMADEPQQGVVDANARAHGVANLYVAGASILPTGGHANPNLTIVALALRLADELRSQHGGRGRGASEIARETRLAEAALLEA